MMIPLKRAVLPRSRKSLKGWLRLQPPKPYSRMPLHVALAAAVLQAVVGDFGTAVALLVGIDCWLRISDEVSGLRADDVKDQRTHPDAAFRGVVLSLRPTKTGMRQSVSVSDPAVANS